MDPDTGLFYPDRSFGRQKEILLRKKRGASHQFHHGAQVERTIARKLKAQADDCSVCLQPLDGVMEIDRYDSALDYTPENIRGLVHPWCHRGVQRPAGTARTAA